MIFSWTHLVISCFFLAGFIMAVFPLLMSRLVAPHARGGDLGLPYECGIRPMGDAWIRFGVNYYIYALLFLAFEVDVLYLLPVSVVYPRLGWDAAVKVFIFLLVLGMAVVFFWAKGVFKWPRRIN
ncbi:MAG: NADH-quinone oxidoreductase subunit A [Desulfosarcinaceae bacterium]